ncbi:Hypothetical protein, putative [Bodo saltans]|uniref:PDZ domain-containing protein n=1 Tax=Bodo saltans TaxID=75058 RepID=A0A0S4J550_BODSA|nr:Hypothetical protein, putative [Bodo saltans]|eukprot:CUG51834.1 Hypothetical protein, putative [Bodo saltans]
MNEANYRHHQSSDPGVAPNTLSLSFERLTVESLALPWHKLEEIHEAIHEKRRMVEQHTSVAMDHLRAVAVLNADIYSLEKEFSAVMSTVVAERSRSQDKLKTLVRQWEQTQASEENARATATAQQHQTALQAAKHDIKKLKKALDEKQNTLNAVQQQRDDMHHLLKEYNLDAAGPLLESIQSRRLEKQREELLHGSGSGEAGNTSVRPERDVRVGSVFNTTAVTTSTTTTGAAQAKRRNTIGADATSFTRDREINQGKLERSLAADTTLSSLHPNDASAISASLHAGQQDATAEIVRLQGELAATRRESMLRKQEAEALRSIREDSTAGLLRSSSTRDGPAGLRGAAMLSSSGSIAASDAVGPYASNRSVVSSSHHAMHQSRSLLRSGRAGAGASSSVSVAEHGGSQWADHPVTLGLDLGTRRQQMGLAGVHVVDVVEGSPAHEAGLQPNDIIVAWAGRVVNRLDDVHAIVRFLTSGPPLTTLDIRYLRPALSDASEADAVHIPTDDEIHLAVIDLDGRVDGPVHSRRGSFHTH